MARFLSQKTFCVVVVVVAAATPNFSFSSSAFHAPQRNRAKLQSKVL